MKSLFLILVMILLSVPVTVTTRINISKPGCQDKCGDVSIPYPFGIRKGCYHGRPFKVRCNSSFTPPRLFYGNLRVTGVSIVDGELTTALLSATDCNNGTGRRVFASLSKFTFSSTKNKFVGIGCSAIASFGGKLEGTYSTGCMSLCDSINDVINGTCSGIGCCQTSIPKGTRKYNVTVNRYKNTPTKMSFNTCNTAFLAEEGWFNFTTSYLMGFPKSNRVPTVLEWTIGNEKCDLAMRNSTSYACGTNTECHEPGSAPGYRCKCKDGYEGNPYLTSTPGSCQDVDECKLNANICKGDSNICKNVNGSYNCSCPFGYRAVQVGNSTIFNCNHQTRNRSNQIIIGICVGLFFLLVSSSWLYWGYRKVKHIKLREKFFMQNGGLMLNQLLHDRDEAVESREGPSKSIAMIFTTKELNKATNNYDETQILGQGGYGTVYKGTLTNGQVVAIKKSKVIDRTQIDQFINEVVVLSQINHRNVVQLLGCCLESEVPLLVYEFITNGTLFGHLHDSHENKIVHLSWDNRLRIATEVAGSLAYLHSDASIPIIHRDVKSSNILLDDNYKAKVSDFGASRLVPFDQTLLNTAVQGTFGYMDPEYFLTGQLTEKSDVYSFGVLLAELLTGQLAVSNDRHEEVRNLANYFISSIRDDKLFDIIDHKFVSIINEDQRQQLEQVAELTKRCLRIKGEKRPKMKEAFMVLDGLMRRSSNHKWIFDKAQENDEEESMHLLAEIRLDFSYNGNSSTTIDDNTTMLPSPIGGR